MDVIERGKRRDMLAGAHIHPLASFVEEIRRSAPGHVPDFDPYDAGVRARILFLLEAPGPRAVATGFISRDNRDPSARTFCAMLAEAGFKRDETLLWNIVPWYIGTGGRIRAATSADVAAGAKWIPPLLALLPELRAVVLVGRKAQRARSIFADTRTRIFETYHPSARVMCRPALKAKLRNDLAAIRAATVDPVNRSQLRIAGYASPPCFVHDLDLLVADTVAPASSPADNAELLLDTLRELLPIAEAHLEQRPMDPRWNVIRRARELLG